MNNPSLSDSTNTPDQAVVASQQAQPQSPTNVAGSAMLDTHIASGESQPGGEPIDAPIATNFSKATGAGDANPVGASGGKGASSALWPLR